MIRENCYSRINELQTMSVKILIDGRITLRTLIW